MMLVQFLAVSLALLIIIKTISDFRRKKIAGGVFFFWMIVWILILVIAFLPQITLPISKVLGVGRGVDAAVYFSIVFIFGFSFYNGGIYN